MTFPSSSNHQRRALITGASSGIGKATALAFAKAGIDVALVSRHQSNLETVAKMAVESNVRAKAYAIDLANLAQVREEITSVINDFGPIDILVNNAGMGYHGKLADTNLKDWQKVIDLNLSSVFECIQAILPSMRARSSGIIINVASIASQQTFAGWGAYSVSKAGLVTLSKVLAEEEKSHGIRVCTISPGAVNTPIWDSSTVNVDFDRQIMLTPEVVAESILYMACLPTLAVIDHLTLMPSAGAL